MKLILYQRVEDKVLKSEDQKHKSLKMRVNAIIVEP
jgi:hypothetical protein